MKTLEALAGLLASIGCTLVGLYLIGALLGLMSVNV
jgi:hypothetical protein